MSSILTAVRRLLPFGRRPDGLVGHDLQGNRYFEIPNPAGGRMKRFVEYRKNRDLSEYTRQELRPPVQWRAWLSHTRPTPPSLTELQTDFNRQSSLRPMIAAIEAREREERIRQGYLLPDGSEPPSLPGGDKGNGIGIGRISGPSTSSERKAQMERFTHPPQPQPILQSQSSSGIQHVNALNSEQIPSSTSSTSSSTSDAYAIPTPTTGGIAHPRETINPAENASREELRRLAEEDTKRRIAQTQGGTTGIGADAAAGERKGESNKVQGVATGEGGGLQPRRRGGK
ncbi:hypothetical protein IAR55_003287 [Kwoniella newhampshirensis]|uniref:NADH dehydrogenase [ubiquinone] 1 alpha subcomplex subunit n=1 Tax=Kwoniella newhampshirensis TaxID=1651941 RepID=A0AAW0YWP5_9TREE